MTASHSGLMREFSFVDGVAIVVGVIVGSAIFIVPANIARALPVPVTALTVWLVGGLLTLGGALSVAELGSMFPGSGGLYTFLRKAYGDCPGFLYTWAFAMLINTGSLAALAAGFGIYSVQIVPTGKMGQKGIAVGCCLILTVINCLGVRVGKWVQNIVTLAKVGGIVVICAVVFSHRTPL
jgi:APA family basic amino acid/polyamine antiporter